MSRSTFVRIASFAAIAVAAGCAQEGPMAGTGTGGTATGSGGAQTGAGGSTGAGGAQSGAGGAQTGAGGAQTGAGGRGGTGGMVATGGSGGGVGAGGSTGAGGAGITPATLVPMLDGFLWIGTCAAGAPSTGNPTDCPVYPTGVATCPNVSAPLYANRGALIDRTIPVMGTAGATYMVTMEVRGVTGLRCYNGGTRTPPLATDVEGMSTGNDGWQVGGTPVESLWNTWEFHVRNAAGTEVGVYYLNAVQTTSIYCQRHETFYMRYMAVFPVPGGGSILARIHDSNCAGQQNCGGIDNQTTCASPRTISLAGMDPQPPASFVQPPVTNNYRPQWLFFDVKSVTGP